MYTAVYSYLFRPFVYYLWWKRRSRNCVPFISYITSFQRGAATFEAESASIFTHHRGRVSYWMEKGNTAETRAGYITTCCLACACAFYQDSSGDRHRPICMYSKDNWVHVTSDGCDIWKAFCYWIGGWVLDTINRWVKLHLDTRYNTNLICIQFLVEKWTNLWRSWYRTNGQMTTILVKIIILAISSRRSMPQ